MAAGRTRQFIQIAIPAQRDGDLEASQFFPRCHKIDDKLSLTVSIPIFRNADSFSLVGQTSKSANDLIAVICEWRTLSGGLESPLCVIFKIHSQGEAISGWEPALIDQSVYPVLNDGLLLQLQGTVSRSVHELNNILTAAHCLIDLLSMPQSSAAARKHLEDLRRLLGEVGSLSELLRREGNAALNSALKLVRSDSSGGSGVCTANRIEL